MSAVVLSAPTSRPAFGRRGSRFAAIQVRAWARNSSMSSIVSVIVVVLSDPGPHAQLLAVPRGVAEQPGVGGDAAQVQVLVVLPRVPDPAEHLEARLDELDAGVPDEGLGHARGLRPVVVA